MSNSPIQEAITKKGMSFDQYLETMHDRDRAKWEDSYSKVSIPESVEKILSVSTRPIHIVVFSADWCGDSRFGVPILAKIADLNPNLHLHILDRDENIELLKMFKMNGETRVPTVVIMNELFEEITRWIERSALGYWIRYQTKLKFADKDKEEYVNALRNLLSDQKQDLIADTISEFQALLTKAIVIVNTSSKLNHS